MMKPEQYAAFYDQLLERNVELVTDPRIVYRALDKLRNEGKLERIGGKRYGRWKICR